MAAGRSTRIVAWKLPDGQIGCSTSRTASGLRRTCKASLPVKNLGLHDILDDESFELPIEGQPTRTMKPGMPW
jgi:hypothetical protein